MLPKLAHLVPMGAIVAATIHRRRKRRGRPRYLPKWECQSGIAISDYILPYLHSYS